LGALCVARAQPPPDAARCIRDHDLDTERRLAGPRISQAVSPRSNLFYETRPIGAGSAGAILETHGLAGWTGRNRLREQNRDGASQAVQKFYHRKISPSKTLDRCSTQSSIEDSWS
jgi:hypothetical protein